MIYLYIVGNCGNQFFQYAFARKLSILTNDKITICWKDEKDRENRDQLKNFHITDVEHMYYHKKYLLRTLFYKLRGILSNDGTGRDFERRFAHLFSFLGIYNVLTGYYKFKIRKGGDKYLQGYFESTKYFLDIDDIICKEFQPLYKPLKHNEAIYRKISETNSVCVTIRRGDFLHSEYRNQFMVCDEEYFYRGMEYIQKKIQNPVWFVFSDDVEWVKNNMNFCGEVYFERGDDPIWEKLHMMSQCKHFVISNSTFSWWAQHLSNNKEKIVVAPDVWRWNDPDANDIREDNWHLLKIKL